MRHTKHALAISIALAICSTPLHARAASIEKGLAAYHSQHYEDAFGILSPLARQGQPDAELTLARMYHAGRGVEQDVHEAVYWYCHAASHGSAEAQFQLGLFYLDGNVVNENEDLALDWLEKAAEQGHQQAARLRYMVLNNELLVGC